MMWKSGNVNDHIFPMYLISDDNRIKNCLSCDYSISFSAEEALDNGAVVPISILMCMRDPLNKTVVEESHICDDWA